GFATDRGAAGASNLGHDRGLGFLRGLLEREQYDVVFTLLPTAETHGHHRAAAAIAREAAASLPVERRPLVLGAEPRSRDHVSGKRSLADVRSDGNLRISRRPQLSDRGELGNRGAQIARTVSARL